MKTTTTNSRNRAGMTEAVIFLHDGKLQTVQLVQQGEPTQ